MSDTPLDFDHLGEFEVNDEIAMADVSYFGPQFEGIAATGAGPRRRLQAVLEVEEGRWHALIGQGPDGAAAVLLLCHDRELAEPGVFEHAEAVALLQIDSGRLVAGHEGLRSDPQLLTVLPSLPADDFPGIVLDAGAAVDDLEPGNYTVLASAERPHTVLFVVLTPN